MYLLIGEKNERPKAGPHFDVIRFFADKYTFSSDRAHSFPHYIHVHIMNGGVLASTRSFGAREAPSVPIHMEWPYCNSYMTWWICYIRPFSLLSACARCSVLAYVCTISLAACQCARATMFIACRCRCTHFHLWSLWMAGMKRLPKRWLLFSCMRSSADRVLLAYNVQCAIVACPNWMLEKGMRLLWSLSLTQKEHCNRSNNQAVSNQFIILQVCWKVVMRPSACLVAEQLCAHGCDCGDSSDVNDRWQRFRISIHFSCLQSSSHTQMWYTRINIFLVIQAVHHFYQIMNIWRNNLAHDVCALATDSGRLSPCQQNECLCIIAAIVVNCDKKPDIFLNHLSNNIIYFELILLEIK